MDPVHVPFTCTRRLRAGALSHLGLLEAIKKYQVGIVKLLVTLDWHRGIELRTDVTRPWLG